MDTTNATLLLVDDDAMNRDALSRRLERSGYRGAHRRERRRSARDGRRRSASTLVLLDVMMPGMSGIETLRRLRASRSLSELPVIMVTAKDAQRRRRRGARSRRQRLRHQAGRLRRRAGAHSHAGDGAARRSADRPAEPRAVHGPARARCSRAARTSRQARVRGVLPRRRPLQDHQRQPRAPGRRRAAGRARRGGWSESLRSTDTVARIGADYTLARLGGDEFTVLLDGVSARGRRASVAERLLAAASEAVHRCRDARSSCRSASAS